ncbi:MAG: diguanylate cyclase [Deltaproteobacteria bacterium]|nr:diguanylate cyclase [Deltaproteobacteria bacterium]
MCAATHEDCFPTLPTAITPELARSCADKMNVLFQLQLLSRSVNDAGSAFNLLVDLARDLVPYDRVALCWREDADAPFRLRLTRGFADDASGPRPGDLTATFPDPARPLLLTAGTCASEGAQSLLRHAGATSLVSMPLYAGEAVLGLLQLYRESAPAFRTEDAHLLRVFTLAFDPIFDGLLNGARTRDFAFLDPLTGLFNRRYFEQHLERELDRARRTNAPLSVLFVQAGDFRHVKERHGHTTAEALLLEVAKRLRSVCRKSDSLARYREEDFAIILPKTGKEILPIVARRVFDALDQPLAPDLIHVALDAPAFSLSAVAYPEDAFSVESLVTAGFEGLALARQETGRRYHQFPSPKSRGDAEDILDPGRMGLFRESILEPDRLLNFFASLCLDTVPADRVSILVREEDSLILQVALGFEGQEEIVRTTHLPLSSATVSSWVAQRREPLLVRDPADTPECPRRRQASYRSQSFFSFPLLQGEDLLGVIHFSDRSDGTPFSEEDVESFRPLAAVMSRHLAEARHFGKAQESFLQHALFGLVDLVEQQVPGMARHSEKVARLVEAVAARLGYAEEEVRRLGVSARLHDLGTASFRSRVLAEPRALSPRERVLAQRHPLLGWKFLEGLPLGGVDRDAILYHHEREDGSGYFGKQGHDIPPTAKILAAADVYQALTSPRPYRPAVTPEEALGYLDGHRGTLFDAGVVDALASVVKAN